MRKTNASGMDGANKTIAPFIRLYTQVTQGQHWLAKYQGRSPLLACVLGFTKTGLIPDISTAGATPDDRRYTAIADAEFLYNGPQQHSRYPLPPLQVGASPVLISRAVVEALSIPIYLFNAGLPEPPAVPSIDLGGTPAECVSTGRALQRSVVEHLFQQGLYWGKKLAAEVPESYMILAECVVGGTTTALAVLTALGIAANGKVNSSHPACNHQQKWAVVQRGLTHLTLSTSPYDAFDIMAAVGDPMQPIVAGMSIAASHKSGVLLAGGTQMLAVFALAKALARQQHLVWQPENIVVGTTRWVAEDPTGDTQGLATLVGSVPLLATQLSFADSQIPQLQVYEQGYVKEGVGAGGCAIAASLYQEWQQTELLDAIDALAKRYSALRENNIL